MEWRSSWFSGERRILLHTVLVLVISFVFLIAGRPVSGLVGNLTTTVFYYPFHKLKSTLSTVSHTAEENAILRANLVETSSRLQFYFETLEENRRLRSLLGFIPPSEFLIVPTEIIGVHGSGMPSTVLINMGERDSIRVNQTVVNRNGLAGRVAQVMPDYSVVYLLTEPRCRVAARVKRSREQGIIRYNMNLGMILDNLPRLEDVVVGDTIITSGLGGIFPEGLIIGEVKSVDLPEREFFYSISISPAVNFNGLDELYVLVKGE
ncbi:MAG: rod shape-determining protein MreC [FCB group bacterium]|nr:rod shape-determining protein MreC [FCB group bacterium]